MHRGWVRLAEELQMIHGIATELAVDVEAAAKLSDAATWYCSAVHGHIVFAATAENQILIWSTKPAR